MLVLRLLGCVSYLSPLTPERQTLIFPIPVDWLKWDEWVSEQQNRILEVWREAGRPYEAGHGVDLVTSVESGKRVPEGVIKEHERQKELGWDVAGNIDAS